MSSLSWKKALSLRGLELSDDEKAAGWPDAFDVENLAVLQFPMITSTTKDKAAIRRSQGALIEALEEAIDLGGLDKVERSCMVEVFKEVPVRHCIHEGVDVDVPGIEPDQWRALGGICRKESMGFESRFYDAVMRDSFRLWFVEQGESPSEHIQAWFDSASRRPKEQAKSGSDNSESPADVLEGILKQCENRAEKVGKSFSVEDMPGQIAQFFDLCQRLEPVFKKQSSIESFKRYTKSGRCKWSKSAKANPSAEPLFKELFPEAYENGGAVAARQRRG